MKSNSARSSLKRSLARSSRVLNWQCQGLVLDFNVDKVGILTMTRERKYLSLGFYPFLSRVPTSLGLLMDEAVSRKAYKANITGSEIKLFTRWLTLQESFEPRISVACSVKRIDRGSSAGYGKLSWSSIVGTAVSSGECSTIPG